MVWEDPFTCLDDEQRCQEHPSAHAPGGGVCPECLRARLLRLCPDCAGEMPHGCSCSFPASPRSLSSSPLDVARSAGRVPRIVGGEPGLPRSRSAAFGFSRPRSGEAAGGNGAATPGGSGWFWPWPFARAKKAEKGCAAKNPPEATSTVRLQKSRSVGVLPGAHAAHPGRGAAHGSGHHLGWKGWCSRYLRIPINPFRRRRTSKVIQARSPAPASG